MEGYFRYYDSDHSPDELRRIVQGKDAHKVCCFSLADDEMLLWTHYASNHTGVCIEVDTDDARSAEVTFEAIKYQARIPWLRRDDNMIRSARDILSTKISKWRYERAILAFSRGPNDSYKVGRITRIILGIRVDAALKELVERSARGVPVIQAKLELETNSIVS